MITVWLVASAAWSALSIAAALLFGRAIALADRHTPPPPPEVTPRLPAERLTPPNAERPPVAPDGRPCSPRPT